MKNWFFSINGAVTLSILTLLSHMWRGFLDAMFVLPVDFGDEATMQMAAITFTLIFAGWAWALFAAWRGSRRGLVAAFVINLLILLAVPVSWPFFYCTVECRAEAGIFNFANMLNLILGFITAVLLAVQLWQKPQPIAQA